MRWQRVSRGPCSLYYFVLRCRNTKWYASCGSPGAYLAAATRVRSSGRTIRTASASGSHHALLSAASISDLLHHKVILGLRGDQHSVRSAGRYPSSFVRHVRPNVRSDAYAKRNSTRPCVSRSMVRMLLCSFCTSRLRQLRLQRRSRQSSAGRPSVVAAGGELTAKVSDGTVAVARVRDSLGESSRRLEPTWISRQVGVQMVHQAPLVDLSESISTDFPATFRWSGLGPLGGSLGVPRALLDGSRRPILAGEMPTNVEANF